MDHKFTQEIADWLNTPAAERDITAGATMLLRLNGNRFFYANVMRRPDKFADKLTYELRKHLQIRLDNRTIDDVVRLERQVMPAAQQTLSSPPVVSTDDELPEGQVARGKRPDHDRLPAAIQALWDDNLRHFKTVKNAFEQLKTMEQAPPCDRYEFLKIMDEADKKYRANLQRYDSFVIGSEPSDDDNAADDQAARKVNAARKTLTKYKRVLAKAIEQDDVARADTAKNKILDCVKTIRANGAVVGNAVTNELLGLGINIDEQ